MRLLYRRDAIVVLVVPLRVRPGVVRGLGSPASDLPVALPQRLLCNVGHFSPLSLIPEGQSYGRSQDAGGDGAGHDGAPYLGLRHERMLRQIVGLRLVHEDELGVVAPDTSRAADLRRAVDVRLRVASSVKLRNPLFGDPFELLDLAEHDRVGRTRLGASWLHPVALPVVAKGALKDPAIFRDRRDDAVGTGRDTVAAAVADVGLDVDVVELVADDCAGRTRLLAGRLHTMLADVAHERPAPQSVELCPTRELFAHVFGQSDEVNVAGEPALFGVLNKSDVAPGSAGELLGVVVGVAGQLVAVGGDLVPLLAGNLAGLAADADRCVGQESCRHFSYFPSSTLRRISSTGAAGSLLMRNHLAPKATCWGV